MDKSLALESITFGKYKDKTLHEVLKDRSYCSWLVKQDWFKDSYEYLYNRVCVYDPKMYFLLRYEGDSADFMDTYQYFNLTPLEDVKLDLTDNEKTCYLFYLTVVDGLKNKIEHRVDSLEENIYDIKAPTKWLSRFEKAHNLNREVFKEFLLSHELPNITYIVEDIKREGGIEYKGAQSFIIAKNNSVKQELWWENMLKDKYGEGLGVQFKYNSCIFDFIVISTNTLFEAKLGLKDFDVKQYKKYKLTLLKYRVIYLIGYDAVIVMEKGMIYTTNPDYYNLYKINIPDMKNPSDFDNLIYKFEVEHVENLSSLFNVQSTK
jgi:hypothetical protein